MSHLLGSNEHVINVSHNCASLNDRKNKIQMDGWMKR
uniref:Uncharacterized protein n=1 Tax=Onchocerca volvulus TaxID=6282 RepID=A0A8R1Y4Y3_ONCVO